LSVNEKGFSTLVILVVHPTLKKGNGETLYFIICPSYILPKSVKILKFMCDGVILDKFFGEEKKFQLFNRVIGSFCFVFRVKVFSFLL
jgi:hypothetical protein